MEISMTMTASKPIKKIEKAPVHVKEKKPTIPNDILKVFLDRNINKEDNKKINMVVDAFLWQLGNIQRYRINVWMKEPVDGMFCERHWIGYSWFVHYDVTNKTLTDKSIAPKPKKEKIF